MNESIELLRCPEKKNINARLKNTKKDKKNTKTREREREGKHTRRYFVRVTDRSAIVFFFFEPKTTAFGSLN